jgi:hypothetical protein
MPPKAAQGRQSKAQTRPASASASKTVPSPQAASKSPAGKKKPTSPAKSRIGKRPAGKKAPRVSNIQRKSLLTFYMFIFLRCIYTDCFQPATQHPPAGAGATNRAPSRSKKSANTKAPSICSYPSSPLRVSCAKLRSTCCPQKSAPSCGGSPTQSRRYKRLPRRLWCICSRIRICARFTPRELPLCRGIFNLRGGLGGCGVDWARKKGEDIITCKDHGVLRSAVSGLCFAIHTFQAKVFEGVVQSSFFVRRLFWLWPCAVGISFQKSCKLGLVYYSST